MVLILSLYLKKALLSLTCWRWNGKILPRMGVTGLSSTEEPMEGGEHDGEHTLGSLGALFKLDSDPKLVAIRVCGGLFDELESDIGATLLFPAEAVRVIVFTTVDPT